MNKIYWDDVNGKVTADSSYAPIIKGQDIYIETYGIYGTNKIRINIAYTQAIKENENMYYYRKAILNKNNLEYCDLGKLIKLVVPSDKYDSLAAELKGENKICKTIKETITSVQASVKGGGI